MTRDGERASSGSMKLYCFHISKFRTELGLQSYGMWGKLQNLDTIVVDIRTFPSRVRELILGKLVFIFNS